METAEEIIKRADQLIRKKGYNAFSYKDIAEKMQIKTASVHYHFPAKKDLGIAVVAYHIQRLNRIISRQKQVGPESRLEGIFQYYTQLNSRKELCIVGALTTDLNTLDKEIAEKLSEFSALLENWISELLTEGKREGVFHFQECAEDKALLLITNLMAAVQISRIGKLHFDRIISALKQEIFAVPHA